MLPADLYCEFSADGRFIRLEPLCYERSGPQFDWYDSNWLTTKITLSCGSFHGKYMASMLTTAFSDLRSDLDRLYNNLSANAHYSCLEEQLILNFTGDGLGHFAVNVTATDSSGSRLQFDMTLDHTSIKPLIQKLDAIINHIPHVGR
jgi:hypothetical protein